MGKRGGSRMSELNIYQKIMQVRCDVIDAGIKKTGHNKFSNFWYYELKDFLSFTTKAFKNIKLYSKFSITPATPTNAEMVTFKVVNSEKVDEVETYTLPTAECFIGQKKDGTGGADPIQNLGGKITYLRRYMYLIVLDLIEDDEVDAKEQIAKKATPKKHVPTTEPRYTDEKIAVETETFNGLSDTMKTIENFKEGKYKAIVLKTICEELKVAKWFDIKFTKDFTYKDLRDRVNKIIEEQIKIEKAGL